MPRPPTHEHPLRDICKAATLSQKEMAHLANISVSMVQKIQNGVEPLTSNLAFRIHIQTGCDLEADSKGSLSIRATKDRSPYTREDFTCHRRFLEHALKWDSEGCYPALISVLALVLRAAQSKGVLPLLVADLGDFILEQCKRLKLRIEIADELTSEEFGLAEKDRDHIEELAFINPFRAGFELNLHKGTKARLARLAERKLVKPDTRTLRKHSPKRVK